MDFEPGPEDSYGRCGSDKTGIGLLSTGRYSQILDSIVIGGYFFIVTPNTIPIRQQSGPPACSVVILIEF